MFDSIINSVKRNHFAQMAICCMIPVVIIAVLQFAGFNSVWLYPLALFACIGSHFAMMHFSSKEGKTCH